MTRIEWTDAVWNPVTGCTKVSTGCRNCYAERIAGRMWGKQYGGRKFTEVRCHEDRLDIPLRWRKPRRVFVNSMSDLFHESVPAHFIGRVFGIMAAAHHHTFQVLTKRPERMRQLLHAEVIGPLKGEAVQTAWEFSGRTTPAKAWRMHWPWPNVWLGVSCEDQKAADERVPLLLQTPAAVRFLSCEPLLGPISLRHIDADAAGHQDICQVDALTGRHTDMGRPCADVARIDWVIAGGESGPGHRPMDIEWARSLREQCRGAGVPFFFKQVAGLRPGLGVDALGEVVQEFPA